ncbi:hypothetical protein [Novosphingobium sp. B 225]|uniref:hypothetical protein n=1 Tax=Novosphingobium sp. B 225 TaxID=1961849 RepID=UPI001C3D7C9C|nr:hypothetical protein [Novosphingobium sp. B 225]
MERPAAPAQAGLVFLIWLFAIPWTAFALFWTWLAATPLREGQHIGGYIEYGFPLFGLPFILIGLGMLATPFRLLLRARRVVYALTDQRVIQLYAGRSTKVQSVQIDQVGQVDAQHDPDGYGRLSIATTQFIDRNRDRRTDAFTILGVPDAARLERLLLEQVRARKALAGG